MGLDDMISDECIITTTIKEMVDNGILNKYNSQIDTLDKLLDSEKNIRYNGYSMVYHMIYPIQKVMMQGSRFEALETLPEEEQKWIEKRIRKIIREKIVYHLKGCDDLKRLLLTYLVHESESD